MLSLIAFPFLAVVTVWLLSRWTALRLLPIYVVIPVFISFFIPISIVALVPFDLVDDETLNDHARLIMWRVIYWASFFLMWVILPVLQAYVESGYHAPLLKLKDALKSTVRYHLIVLVLGVAGAIYMGISTGLSFTNLKGVGVALSHSYGLVLVIWMLGHGCVEIPRSMWFNTVDERLKKLYTRATMLHDNYADAQSSYDDVVAKIMALEPIKTDKYAEWLDSIIVSIRSQDFPLGRTRASRAQPRDLTASNLASLSSRYYRELSRNTRSRAEWMKLLADAQELEQHKQTASFFTVRVRPVLVKVVSAGLAALSVVVTWSEIVAGTRISLVDIALKHAAAGLKLILAIAVLGYMCICVNSSLMSMKIFNLYAIVPKHTDASSLLFFAAYALRLTVPLSYNFLMLNSTQQTVFQEFLGKFINLTALGKYFNEIIPRLILIPILMTAFNFYETVKDYLGFGLGLDYFDDAEANNNVLLSAQSEGRELVRRSLSGFQAQPEPAVGESEGLVQRVKSWFA